MRCRSSNPTVRPPSARRSSHSSCARRCTSYGRLPASSTTAAPIPAGRRIGLYHFGLKVGDSDDDLRAALARLVEADVPIIGATDHNVTHSLYISDPDGNEIELYIDVPGVDWRNDPGLIAAPIKPLRL